MILIQPKDVWDRINDAGLQEMLLIAENEEKGNRILASKATGDPTISVVSGFNVVYDEDVISAEDCARTVQMLINIYLDADDLDDYVYPDEVGNKQELDSDTDFIEEEIEYREMELNDAVYEMMLVVADGVWNGEIEDEICEDLKEHILRFLAKCGIPVRRPMYLEGENGKFFTEYPYDYLLKNKDSSDI